MNTRRLRPAGPAKLRPAEVFVNARIGGPITISVKNQHPKDWRVDLIATAALTPEATEQLIARLREGLEHARKPNVSSATPSNAIPEQLFEPKHAPDCADPNCDRSCMKPEAP